MLIQYLSGKLCFEDKVSMWNIYVFVDTVCLQMEAITADPLEPKIPFGYFL